MDQPAFAVVGPGRLGLHLTHALTNAGWRCTAIRGRRPITDEGPRHELSVPVWDTWDNPESWPVPRVIFITVADDSLELVDHQLATALELSSVAVLHTSGLTPASRMHRAKASGASVASWHPLQSFPPFSLQEVTWQDIPCAIEGDAAAVETGFAAARAIGAAPWTIDPELKTIYHAAAVIAANLTHILISEASRLIERCGYPTDDANPLASLVHTSTQAALEAPDLSRLTGPIARGDFGTIKRHLEALPEPLAGAYESTIKAAETQLANLSSV